MKNLMNKTALAVMSFALTLALALIFALNETPSALAQSATPTPTDYDSDNDGLIDIGYPDQLNAMRHDPDGNGSVDITDPGHAEYTAAFPNPADRMGCPEPTEPTEPPCKGYELVDDIDLAGYSNWTPIPGWLTTFSGENPRSKLSHTISNMTTTGAGLFGSIDKTETNSGTVRNVALKGATVTLALTAGESRTPLRNAGVLAGTNRGKISGVQVEGVLTFTGIETYVAYAQVGGLVGQNNGGTIDLSWADVDINVNGAGARAGGFVGDSRGDEASITASFASGDVAIAVPSTYVKRYNRAGGFIATNKGLITNSITFGEVSPRIGGTNPFGVHCWDGGQWLNVAPSPSGCKPKD